MKSRLYKSLALVIAWAFSLPAAAAVLVDTGPGELNPTVAFTLRDDVWLAGQFSLDSATTITEVEGWMDIGRGGNLRAALYADNGDVPGSQLLSTTDSFPADGSSAQSWHGIGGLDWSLGAGTYWLSFETDDPFGSFSAAMAGGASDPPLSHSASTLDQGGSWNVYGADALTIGMRISGDPAPVPEPSTYMLMLVGLLGLGYLATRSIRNRESGMTFA